ncbi:hypothetical protein TVNIR_0915 [Thioalkalivibrio nitratireducens DSM 14787]|uniref:Uncharacterized protein n=1 Tax=Thioalkalivibrio nitratireducens (strain DSM 14787 / UNIQEM 213 / ALEN2) TaxID=1255043 RepID=L0DUD3_THIND|nr:hypothetical protein TVNIR_0915 [Thioalkalivibrio nitratireducens DSM 14787]
MAFDLEAHQELRHVFSSEDIEIEILKVTATVRGHEPQKQD